LSDVLEATRGWRRAARDAGLDAQGNRADGAGVEHQEVDRARTVVGAGSA
jgi:hypothetical protein